MPERLTGILRGVSRLTPWHITEILFVVAVVFCAGFLWQSFMVEKSHTTTIQVWVPADAAPINDLFGGAVQLDSSYSDAIFWEDTHTLGEYQELSPAAHFFALVDGEVKYLAVMRNADGTTSVARTTVSLEIPGKDFRQVRTFNFDTVVGTVTVQDSWNLGIVILTGVLPFLLCFLISGILGFMHDFRWHEPMCSSERVSA